jgi:hypothetical protein
MRSFLFLIALSTAAQAKDVMIILNDQEQAAYKRVLDSATKAEGVQIAPITVYLMNKLNQAMEVVERKDNPEHPKAQEPAK